MTFSYIIQVIYIKFGSMKITGYDLFQTIKSSPERKQRYSLIQDYYIYGHYSFINCAHFTKLFYKWEEHRSLIHLGKLDYIVKLIIKKADDIQICFSVNRTIKI